MANAGRAAERANPEPTLDTGPPLSDSEAVALLVETLGATVTEDWRRTADGTWRDQITGHTSTKP